MREFNRRGGETPRRNGGERSKLLLGGSASQRFIIFLGLSLTLACSVPNLEPQQCIEARTTVREFYSMHFGGDMVFSDENLEKRKEFLTPTYYESLRGHASETDPFTQMSDLPKAFRVGECTPTAAGVQFDVLLFWKTDTRSDQRSIKVDAEKVGDRWFVAKVD